MTLPLVGFGKRLKPWKQHLLLFLTCWFIYLFHIGPWPGVNENRYIDLTRSIVEDGSFTIDRYHYNTVDKSYFDGHYYAGAPPGPSIIAVPIYLLLKSVTAIVPLSIFDQYDKAYYIRDQLGGASAPDSFVDAYPFSEFLVAHVFLTALIPCFLSSLTSVLLYQILGWVGINDWRRLTVAILYSFGTLTFFYSVRFYAHAESAFCLMLAFCLLFASRHQHIPVRWSVPVAGLMLGIAASMEYTIAPIMTAIGFYVLIGSGRRQWITFGAGVAVPLILLAAYQWVCFGTPLTTPYSLPMSPTDPGPHVDQMNVGVGGFGLPSFESLFGLSFSPYRGIFVYCPILILAIYGLVKSLLDRSNPYRLEWGVIGAAVAMQFLFNSAMLRFWSAGYVFGPRYLVPMIPLLMIALGPAFRWLPARLIIFVGAISVLINWAGTQYIVSQNAFSSIGLFVLSGPSTQSYEFMNQYFTTYTDWRPVISPMGGYLLLSLAIVALWTWRDKPSEAS